MDINKKLSRFLLFFLPECMYTFISVYILTFDAIVYLHAGNEVWKNKLSKIWPSQLLM